MTISRDIRHALAVFHLDNPEATWADLKERLQDIAEGALTMAHSEGELDAIRHVYDELRDGLRSASARLPLSIDQQRASGLGIDIMQAAISRTDGDPRALSKLVDALSSEGGHLPLSMPLSVGPTSGSAHTDASPLTWNKLSELYLEEHRGQLVEGTLSNIKSIHRALGALLGDLDLRSHNRSDLVAVRSALLERRKASTVNNMLAKLIAVLAWAERCDLIAKNYGTKLKLTKGAESERESFTREEVGQLLGTTRALPWGDWKRTTVDLLAVTGARLGEIVQLRPEDFVQVEGHWCISINDDNDKSLKNTASKRVVPLVDGALGFNLEQYLEAIKAAPEVFLPSVQGITPQKASRALGRLLEGLEWRSKNKALHSLRHHFASSMQTAEVELTTAQAILGHADKTVTFGTYGSGLPIKVLHSAISKALAERATQ